MIEIIFDRNPDDTFLNEKRPVFILEQQPEDWLKCRKTAKELLTTYKNDRIVVIRTAHEKISVNWLAVALFIESCFMQGDTEAFVFKTENYEAALASYKPFVALTIGLNYAFRLYQEDLKNIYKDIAGLSYLGLSIKEDYLTNRLIVKLNRGGEVKKMQAATVQDALIAIGVIKSLALASVKVSLEWEFVMADVSQAVDIDRIIDEIVSKVFSLSDGFYSSFNI